MFKFLVVVGSHNSDPSYIGAKTQADADEIALEVLRSPHIERYTDKGSGYPKKINDGASYHYMLNEYNDVTVDVLRLEEFDIAQW